MVKINSGQRFGMLTVIKEVDRFYQPSGQSQRGILCKCDCGKLKTIRLSHLNHKRVISCGCLNGEVHGERRSKLYNKWRGIKNRCYREKYHEYHLYGGRGIKMCDEWNDSYLSFKRWCLDNGYKDGLVIDRINNDLGYFPDNCRFVTAKQNVRNRRNTLTIGGRPLIEILEELNISHKYNLVITRIRRGWNESDAINKPARAGKYRVRFKNN